MSEKVVKRESRAVWFSRIKDWQQSGLSKAAYCRQFSLNAASFYKWFAKFQESKKTGSDESLESSAFVPVIVTPEPVSTVTLQCGDVSLSFQGSLLPEQLLPWIKVLRLGAC